MRIMGQRSDYRTQTAPVREGVKDQGCIRAGTGGDRWTQVGLRDA